jgi:hypothetical protein
MVEQLGAVCTDFYVNQKLSLRMDIPSARDTILSLFDRVRRELPMMERLRRYQGELALESRDHDSQYSWLALRKTSIRSGWVNPESLSTAYKLHRCILEVAPYFLSISPLDVEHVELVFGFDLEAGKNRNEIVLEALLGNSPLAGLIEGAEESVLDVQPFIGFSLTSNCELQAFVEVKTRTTAREVAAGRFSDSPISVYLTVRKYGSMKTIEDLLATFGMLAGHAERLAEQRVIPQVVLPIRMASQGR